MKTSVAAGKSREKGFSGCLYLGIRMGRYRSGKWDGRIGEGRGGEKRRGRKL